MARKNPLEESSIIWSQIVAKAWQDKKFKEKLLKSPKEALKEMGFAVPSYFKDVKIHDYSNETTLHLNLVAPPPMKEISEKELEKIAAGQCGPLCNQ